MVKNFSFSKSTSSIIRTSVVLLFLSARACFGQEMSLTDIAHKQHKIHQQAAIELTAWAGANIAYGTIANFNSSGEAQQFHRMNALWNTVNLGLGVTGLLIKPKQSVSFPSILQENNKAKTIYLVNAALDLTYITGGFLMREYSNNFSDHRRQQWLGFGSSLILQGGYLLLHDAIAYGRFKKLDKSLNPFWSKVELTTHAGVGLRYSLD